MTPARRGAERVPRRARVTAALLLVAALVSTCGAQGSSRPGSGWASPGLVGGGGWPFNGSPLSPIDAPGATYLRDSSVVRLGNGQIRLIPFGSDTPTTVEPSDPRVSAAVRSDGEWLAHGTVPGYGVPAPGSSAAVTGAAAPRSVPRVPAPPSGGPPASPQAGAPSAAQPHGVWTRPSERSGGAAVGRGGASAPTPGAAPPDGPVGRTGDLLLPPPNLTAPRPVPPVARPDGPEPGGDRPGGPSGEPEGAASPEERAAAEDQRARASGYRDMAARSLLDLRLLTRPNGASLASWFGAWRYCWPRDSAFAAAAFAVTGHPSEARRVLRFLARVQHENGLWAARYNADGTAVTDGRPPQLDSLGWVLWSSWLFRAEQPEEELPELWPMVRRAADHLAGSLGRDGLPPPSSDYMERGSGREQDPNRPTLGVVGPVLAGLRSAAAVADGYGKDGQAARWRSAAHRLSDAVARHFTPHGYPRSPVAGGLMDTSVTFLSPPFAPADPGVSSAVENAAEKLRLPNGGVLPGEKWPGHKLVAWTPEMALFTLSAATSGRTDEALGRLDWLSRHRTSLGVLPEKVGERGQPAGVAPLGWTASMVVLSLAALERPLPVPPA